jgi:hypothetical protein
MSKDKKTQQLTVRVTQKTLEDIDAIAHADKRDRSDVVRLLIEWAASQYVHAGTLRDLVSLKLGDLSHLRKALEMEQEAYRNADSPSAEKRKPRTGTSG